ncbi:MAG: hypothetical protein JXR19_10385 [Bacteroidia bacterium]
MGSFFHYAADAQSSTVSPYSLSSIGELSFRGFNDQRNMGGTSRALRSPWNYSPVNPASYTGLSNVVYNAGANFSLGRLSTDSLSTETNEANISYFSMAFAKPNASESNWGLSFGFYQLSDVGYDIKAENGDTFSSYNIFRGSGGINTAYIGGAVTLVKGLSVGANFNYNFGNIQSLKAQVFPVGNSHFSFIDETQLYYGGANFDFGVQYSIQQKTKNESSINHVIGATFHTKTNLKGSGYRFAESFFGRIFDEQGSFISIDTILYNDNLSKELEIPSSFGVGYSVGRAGVWSLAAEYEKGMWSSITSELNGKQFFDHQRLSFGFSIVPNPDYQTRGGFFGKVKYSAGVRQEQLYYNFFGEQISELGIGFGLGLPIIKTFPTANGKVAVINRVNLGFEYSKRGTTNLGLVQEEYFTITLGLNFNDKWFIPRKYQ